jgi:hypothetical protein
VGYPLLSLIKVKVNSRNHWHQHRNQRLGLLLFFLYIDPTKTSIMKKRILGICLFLAVSIQCRSQNQTTYRTYTLSSINFDNIESTIYGNRLYNVGAGGSSLLVEKNDLNGNPLLTRSIPLQANADIKVNASNGFLYLNATSSGSIGYIPFIIKLDTANFNIVYYKQIDLNSGGNTFISGSKIMSNGNLMLFGYSAYSSTSTPTTKGFITAVDVTTGNVLYTTTVTVPGPPFNFYIWNGTEISNSTLLFCASSSNGNTYIGKAVKSALSISVTSLYSTNASVQMIDRIPGSSKVMSYDGVTTSRLDTNLSLLSTASVKQFSNSAGFRPFFSQNKVYRIGADTTMTIVDSALNVVGHNSYPTTVSSFTSSGVGSISYRTSFCKSANNLFIVYRPPIYPGRFSLLKTTLNGVIGCSNSLPLESLSAVTVTNVASAVSQGSITAGMSATATPTPVTENVTFTDLCFSTTADIKSIIPAGELKVLYMYDRYVLNSAKTLKSIEVLDLSGKKVRTMVFSAGETQASIDMNDLAKGLFIAQVEFQDRSQVRLKLVNH